MLGAPLPRSAIEAINHQTDGNPLFVIELVKVLIEESADVGVAPIAVRIPDGVRETVGRRLSRLPERCNELLAAASVLGRNFTAKELATAAEESLDVVLANLDTAARAGIVECHGDEPGSHRFTHALIRETLYEEIPTLDRMRLHGRVGDALTALHDARLTSVVTRIAHHYYEAAPLGHTDKAAAFAMRAAESAVATYAYEEAVAHCDRAISTLGLTQLDTDDRLARAHLLKGLSLTMLGDERSLETLFHAVKHALRVESAELLVDVATHLMWATCFAPQPHNVPLLEKALALLPQIDSVARAKALAALAFALRSSGDHRRIQPLVNEALEMAERLRDPAVRCWCFRSLRWRCADAPKAFRSGCRWRARTETSRARWATKSACRTPTHGKRRISRKRASSRSSRRSSIATSI